MIRGEPVPRGTQWQIDDLDRVTFLNRVPRSLVHLFGTFDRFAVVRGESIAKIYSEPEFPISTLSLCENHMLAALSCQVQINIAALGSHRGSFSSFADLFGLFLASNLPGR
jgi:hypothetical protein